jgi:sodium-dependent dicarboxylate transporter 2/3/5
VVSPSESVQDHQDSPLKGRLLALLMVLVAAIAGYLLAPSDLIFGTYKAHIVVDMQDDLLEADFPFELGGVPGTEETRTVQLPNYDLEISGRRSVPYRLNETISYALRVSDSAGHPVPLQLEQVNSTLYGPNYLQRLPPTEKAGDWLRFQMRVPYRAKIATAVLLAVAVLWLTEIIPLAAASLLIPVMIVSAQVSSAKDVLAPFGHPIIFLFMAGFLLAEGMRRTGIDRLMALSILQRASAKPAVLMLTMMGITAFLSMWMSNTASVAIIIPIALAILDKIPNQYGRTGFRRALILGVAYAGAIGGIGSAIGTPANILAMTFLSEFSGTELTFVDWFAYGVPMVLLMVPIIWVYLLLTFRVRTQAVEAYVDPQMYKQELDSLGGLNRQQKIIVVVFVGIVILWLTEGIHHIHASIVALAGVIVLFLTETLEVSDLNQINWNALLTFGGGLAVGGVLVTTGVSDWLALKLVGLSALPNILVIALVAGLTLLIGAFISNTACAAMLVPLAIPLAQILQIDPRLMVAVVAIASSIDFALVIGTPPTMLAYSTGYFETREIFRRGIILDVIGALLLSFGVIWIWDLLGVVTL